LSCSTAKHKKKTKINQKKAPTKSTDIGEGKKNPTDSQAMESKDRKIKNQKKKCQTPQPTKLGLRLFARDTFIMNLNLNFKFNG